MASNREVAFMRRLMSHIAGIQHYAKNIRPEEDSVIVMLKRGAASNKAARIEFRPDRKGQVNVTFSKIEPGSEIVISEHPGIFFDALAQLLYAEAGLMTGEREKEEGVGLYRTTRW